MSGVKVGKVETEVNRKGGDEGTRGSAVLKKRRWQENHNMGCLAIIDTTIYYSYIKLYDSYA
jgi:hypothetical protein